MTDTDSEIEALEDLLGGAATGPSLMHSMRL